MGWSTDLLCGISFNRKAYTNKFLVESDLEEEEQMMRNCEQRLRDLAIMTEPRKMLPADEDGPTDFLLQIGNEVKEQLEQLHENIVNAYKLRLLLDYWDDCHDDSGNPIPVPENIHYDSAFIWE